MYDPAVARWGGVDPHAENYLPISPYNYVGGNPLIRADLDGRDWIDKVKGFVAAVVDDATGGVVNLRDNFSYNDAADYNLGQDVGDATAMVVGAAEMVIGTETATAGGVGLVTSGAVATTGVGAAGGAVISGTAVVGGTAMAAHGTVMAGNGMSNLASQKGRVNIEGKQTGSYTNKHVSGKKYHGKGPEGRAKQSGREKAKEHNDPLEDTDWTPSRNDREAFKDESRRLGNDGGPGNPDNYNKRRSPGDKYRKQDGEN